MKRLIIIAACLLEMGLSGCAPHNRDEILVIRKTKSYHTDECARVKMASTESMTREEARNSNCKPCPRCNPDSGIQQ